jgi:hypothetical protein
LRIPGKRTLTFWWKTSSEAGHDWLDCRVNGVLAKDLDTGAPAKLSGETSWVRQEIRIDSSTTSIVDFTYAKDRTLSEGEDRGWIANLEVGVQPVFKKSPVSIRLKPAEQTLTLSAVVDNATSFQWKKEGVPLSDGVSGEHETSGTTTQTLVIKGVKGSDSGGYTLEAKNTFDTLTSRKAEVVVPVAPVILQRTSPIAAVKSGNVLILSVEATGAPPYMTAWKKDGRLLRRTSGTSLKLGSANELMSGTYSASVANPFGASAPLEIPVTVLPRP